ncbi:hypothetical protein ANCDUO_08088 [Ancylostoma duodenale]|uniref:Uncharacterized protein n=1 Tax=Ancylostoma duodenale TaxID=51022 RepID=A0A0C2CXA7_9BILA|nr:hypothetical protein ANCDUO_08088 [Ancylostoma duodenale]
MEVRDKGRGTPPQLEDRADLHLVMAETTGRSAVVETAHSVAAARAAPHLADLLAVQAAAHIRWMPIHQTYRVSELFPAAPSRVDAAVFNPTSGMMLLFGNRQVYGYYYSRLRGVFQLDSGYPKRLPADISFTPRGALRWINGHQILLSSVIM